ncbi:hypothetical protein JCM10449v2_000970 [Rhodotorula kratochvilovae]
MFLPITSGGDPLALSLPFALAASPTPSSSSSSFSSGASHRTSPSLFDLPTPPSAPISTPSPLASTSSSLLLPFDAGSPPMHPLDTFETSLSGLPSWSATIDPSLLFGLDPSSTFPSMSSSALRKGHSLPHNDDAPIPARSFFPPGSPITSEREPPRAVPLFSESSTLEQRQAQVAALSSLIVNGAAATSLSSAGPAKRTRAAVNGRSRSLSQGRPTAPTGPGAGVRRASVNAEAASATQQRSSPPPSSSKSWLDALREAEAKAKLRRLQTQSGVEHGARKGRLALMHGQLLAASMQEEAQAVAAPALPSGAASIWSIFPTCRGDRGATCNPRCCRSICTCGFDEEDRRFLERQEQAQQAGAASTTAQPGSQPQMHEGSRMAAPSAGTAPTTA